MSSVRFFTPASTSAHVPTPKAPATRCAHCQRELTSGEGRRAEFIGVLGPECVKKYAALEAVLAQANGMEAHEWDQGTINLTHYVLWKLRGIGVAVRVVDVKPGVKALEVVGLSRKPAAVVKSWREVRAEFELRLKLAAAERAAGDAA